MSTGSVEGVYIQSVSRAGQPLPVLPETQLEHGDVITFYGSPKDTKRAVDAAGCDAESARS